MNTYTIRIFIVPILIAAAVVAFAIGMSTKKSVKVHPPIESSSTLNDMNK